jgi:hypothetical protein
VAVSGERAHHRVQAVSYKNNVIALV